MIITLSWLKDHLSTNANLEKIIDKLTGIVLDVDGIKDPTKVLIPVISRMVSINSAEFRCENI